MCKEPLIKLPDLERERKARNEDDPAAVRELLKKQGVLPTAPNQEFPMYLASSGAAFDEYIPPESDAKASIISGTKQWLQEKTVDPTKKKYKTFKAVRRIRNYDEDFDPRKWVDEAQEIYIEAHRALAE